MNLKDISLPDAFSLVILERYLWEGDNYVFKKISLFTYFDNTVVRQVKKEIPHPGRDGV
jgi:hypothetical protein